MTSNEISGPVPPRYVGVFGGGRMGAGIAHAFLAAGASVRIIEATADAAEHARDRVLRSLAKAAERGTLRDVTGAVESRLVVSTERDTLAGCELVIEAVPEDAGLKRTVLAESERLAPQAWLATNTSSLSVARLAEALQAPSRLIGLHFFNPVPASSLIEIVVGPTTSAELVELAQSWAVAIGKIAITVTDSPGFASSRLGVALALEAMRMLESGVATCEDIDLAMTLGYKHPTGPLETTDIVGLDVRLAIAEHLAAELGPRFEPPSILRAKVAAGEVGRKSGRGFYEWDT